MLEAASGSSDRPRILHTLSLDVPDEGELHVSIRASMQPDSDDVSTEPAVPPEGVPQLLQQGASPDSLAPQSIAQPGLLPMLDFEEFQVIYGKWETGNMDLDRIRREYGQEVAELIQAQRAVAMEADESLLRAEAEQVAQTMPDPTPLGSSAGVSSLDAQGSPELVLPQGSVGSPRCCYGVFEQVYGEWKDGHRSDRLVEDQYGRDWIRLFRLWKQWGLSAIWPYLGSVLDMRTDTGDGQPRPLIQSRDTLGEQLRIPFLVVKAHYDRWCKGPLGDEQLEGVYGRLWLELFRTWRAERLEAVRALLDEHVEWSSAEWLFEQGST